MQIEAKVYLESQRGRRSEPVWAVWTQETSSEAKEWPLELRSKKAQAHAFKEKMGKERHSHAGERAYTGKEGDGEGCGV